MKPLKFEFLQLNQIHLIKLIELYDNNDKLLSFDQKWKGIRLD